MKPSWERPSDREISTHAAVSNIPRSIGCAELAKRIKPIFQVAIRSDRVVTGIVHPAIHTSLPGPLLYNQEQTPNNDLQWTYLI